MPGREPQRRSRSQPAPRTVAPRAVTRAASSRSLVTTVTVRPASDAAAFAIAAPVSAANPAGNNGTIKIDGEEFVPTPRARINVFPRALRLIVPAHGPHRARVRVAT